MSVSGFSLSALRSALNNLYDPRVLRASPLIRVLGVPTASDAATWLRHTLVSAIDSLKPADDVPSHTPAQRAYQVLYFRYVQQCNQEEVADQLGLSVRQMRREQRRALEVLAQRLQEQHGLEITAHRRRAPAEGNPPEPIELQWLEEAPPAEPVALGAVLSAVLELVQPIAANYAVRLYAPVGDDLPALAVDTVALRQTLLSLLCVAVRRAAGGELSVTAGPSGSHVRIRMQGATRGTAPASTPEDAANLATARRLVGVCAGSLALTDEPGRFVADILLPAVAQVPVLIVDDNADTLRLLQRYAACTRYRVYGAQGWEQTLSLAEEVGPQIIVLDIMMPRVDGWEMLRRLTQHESIGHIPVIVCTILAQEELAASLGVKGFLRKPVSRRDFLAALDRLAPRPET